MPFSFGLIFILSLPCRIRNFWTICRHHLNFCVTKNYSGWSDDSKFAEHHWVATSHRSDWMVSVPTFDLAIISCSTVQNYHDWWALPVMFDCGDLASFVLWRGGFDVFVSDFHFLFTNQKRTHTCCGWESLWPWVGGDLEWSCIGGIMELTLLS